MKIAIITGSRSDRNALDMVAKKLVNNHMVQVITAVSGRTAVDAVDATSVVTDSIEHTAATIRNYRSDLAIVHGDRHEVLGAALAANMMGVPVAHIGGGDITEGSQDDCFRHAITKLSHIHFASNQDSADRIIQMGEQADRVHVTGCPGIDMVMATPTLDKGDMCKAVGLHPLQYKIADGIDVEWPRRIILVLFHPNTLGDTAAELEALSVALTRRTEPLVLLGPNSDAGGHIICREWQRLAQNRPDTVYHENVGPQVFYSLLKWCDVLVGNSSAGFYEAPCFENWVINIGDRQKGRNQPNCVKTVAPTTGEIRWAFREITLAHQPKQDRLYGDGHAAERIAKVLTAIDNPKSLLRKTFRNVEDLWAGGDRIDQLD